MGLNSDLILNINESPEYPGMQTSKHISCFFRACNLQGSAKRLALGCVNSRPAARGSQEAGFTQPYSPSLYYIGGECKDFLISRRSLTGPSHLIPPFRLLWFFAQLAIHLMNDIRGILPSKFSHQSHVNWVFLPSIG